jgi:hypothetical protein
VCGSGKGGFAFIIVITGGDGFTILKEMIQYCCCCWRKEKENREGADYFVVSCEESSEFHWTIAIEGVF